LVLKNMSLEAFRDRHINSRNLMLKIIAEKISNAKDKSELESIQECWGCIIKKYG